MHIAEILSEREQFAYGDEIVSVGMDNRTVYVISDLHMAGGLNANGNYEGTENFFADSGFCRFIHHLKNRQNGKKALLIINGDFVDFLRIRNFPQTQPEFGDWQDLLSDLGIPQSIERLRQSISKKETVYGLKTDDYKSVWKLHICAQGHQQVFEGLAAWLMDGNDLLIIKGNHDLEWYWRKVRDGLRLILAKSVSDLNHSLVESALEKTVLPHLHFADDKVIIDNKIYIEHGHRYENFTHVDGAAVLENGRELNLPFGSFFNRYMINRIELAYPYIDDVRPRQKILPILIRERFPLALKMIFTYIPFTILIIPKKQYAYALRYLIQFIFFIVLPLGVTAYAIYETHKQQVLHMTTTDPGGGSVIWNYILPQIKNLVFLSLSYFLGRLFSMLSLSAPTTLYPDACKILKERPELELVTFGHTHDPEQKKSAAGNYYNTGTWIPVYELDAADVRIDKTYTFLQLTKDASGNIQTDGLQRWNDDAGRYDAMELRDKI